jgi:hypothetical protein
MTLDEVNMFQGKIRQDLKNLAEFCPLFRKKHERWTAEAYEQAVQALASDCNDLLDRLYELDGVKEVLGEDALVDMQTGERRPRANGGER